MSEAVFVSAVWLQWWWGALKVLAVVASDPHLRCPTLGSAAHRVSLRGRATAAKRDEPGRDTMTDGPDLRCVLVQAPREPRGGGGGGCGGEILFSERFPIGEAL